MVFYSVNMMLYPGVVFLAYISIFQLCHADLPALPSSIRIDSEVTSLTPDSLGIYVVEEHVDSFDGSIRITVLDITEDLEESDLNSYYRVKDYSNDQINIPGVNDYLVVFNHADLLCRSTRTDNWQLRDLTKVLEVLYKSNEFTTLEVEDDRTSLATLALLKIVYANAQLFVLEKEDFMTSHLTRAYFFQAKINLEEDNRVVKIICVMSVVNVLNRDKLEIGKSLLSQVDSSAHPFFIAKIEFDKNDDETNNLNSLELLYSNNNNLLVVSYFLIQERSTSGHSGMKLGKLDERNPFSLPSGAGCYSVTKESLLYIGARQFSGIYESLDNANKRYIAYDSVTGHLRFDTLDEYKMIYNFKQRKLTYIMDTTHERLQPVGGSNGKETSKARCARSSLTSDDENDILQQVRSMENVIGLDESLGVVYLGTAQLEDGTHCLVYEREIGPSQIPFIIKLNLRFKILKNSRFFLVYYFVNEFSVQNSADYRSVWLKRLELSSLSSFSKYKLLSSQVTFSQFAWDLESMVDDSSISDLELLNSVRTFDTIECQPMRAHTRLEILLKQDATEAHDANISSALVGDQLSFDSLEEALMVRISKVTDFPRSELNEFELVRMPLSETTNQMQYVLARAKLMNPLDVIYSSRLVGWCKNIDDIPFTKYGSFVNTDGNIMLRQECMLKLAAEHENTLINMVFCPTARWCAHLEDEESFDYIKKSKGSNDRPDPKIYVCEIYEISKEVDSLQMMSDRLKKNSVVKALDGKEFVVNIAKLPVDVTRGNLSLFKAKVAKVSVIDVNEVETMGILLRKNQCYTTSTKVSAEDEDFKLDIKEIVFDRHHSLFFCHKACQIYQNCHTYSYARSSRTCTLSNIPDNYVRKKQLILVDEDTLKDLKEDTDCSLYALNSMYLFQSKSVVLVARPAALEADRATDYYITLGTLDSCANTCNLDGFNCQVFLHNPLNGICAIEDKDFELYKRKSLTKGEVFSKEVKKNYYIKLLGAQSWNLPQSFHQYSRDYGQYYLAEYSQKIDLTESTYTVGEGEHQISITRPASDSLEEISKIYDIDSQGCLRECTLVKSDCVVADYCFHPLKSIPTRYCAMYRVGGGKSGSLASESLNILSRGSLVSANGCTHYYLNEDFLLLKRLISGDYVGRQETTKEDGERSSYFLNSTLTISNKPSKRYTIDGFSIVGQLLLLALGLYAGMSLSYKPSQISTNAIDSKLLSKLTAAYQWLRFKRQLERTQSRLELNELDDL